MEYRKFLLFFAVAAVLMLSVQHATSSMVDYYNNSYYLHWDPAVESY